MSVSLRRPTLGGTYLALWVALVCWTQMTNASEPLLSQSFSGRTLEPSTMDSLVGIGVGDHNHNHNQTNTSDSTTPTMAPSIVPGNNTNSTTPAPTTKNQTTPAPSTVAPTTAHPTPTPKPYVAPTEPPTHAPSAAPTKEGGSKGGGVSFFRMIGKMLAWCIVMGLGVLLYGFCIQHKYQIAYYLRHFWHCLQAVNAWLIQKVRPDASHNLQRGYAAMFAQERNDAQSLLFDNPNGTMYEGGGGVPDATSDGFVLGQHSNMNFHSMG